MAQILKFFAENSQRTAEAHPSRGGGEVVAMQHIDLETVVETVRVLRELERHSMLDHFNGRGHAAKQ